MKEGGFMNAIRYTALFLTIIGSLNWGLIGLFDVNLVTLLFGVDSLLTNIVYILIGLCSLISLTFFADMGKETH